MTLHRIFSRVCLCLILWLLSCNPTAIAQSNNSDSVRLYFFTMQGCGPCTQVAPTVAEFVRSGYPIQTIDARLQPQWTQQFSITSTPTFVMTVSGQEVGRHTGVLDDKAILGWFERAIQHAGKAKPSTKAAAEQSPPSDMRNSIVRQAGSELTNHLADTTHQGTREPANESEARAMAATVRLQVEDAEGISTATGTVIHSHGGECLVMTCGHVFRESQGRGTISADVGWLHERPKRVSGELVNYDAGPLDVALVVLHAGIEIPSAPLGRLSTQVERDEPVFSIGCDRNAPPTIRRTTISAISACDNAEKYEIVGRPVLGRSGGGLFNSQGELIGVCNAAFVDEDGGLYSSLRNLHHQIQKASLAHLFEAASPVASLLANDLSGADVREPDALPDMIPIYPESEPNSAGPFTAVQNLTAEPAYEAIVILKSKNGSDPLKTVVLENPSAQFLQELEGQSQSNQTDRANRLAQLRMEMPQPKFPNERENSSVRAQSPK